MAARFQLKRHGLLKLVDDGCHYREGIVVALPQSKANAAIKLMTETRLIRTVSVSFLSDDFVNIHLGAESEE